MEALYNKPIRWLRGVDEFSSVVVSTRVRLARNLSTYPFLPAASKDQIAEIDAYLSDKISNLKLNMGCHLYKMHELAQIDKQVLFERHLVSSEHLKAKYNRSVAITEGEMVSIMINEEDHIRMQSLEASFNPSVAHETICKVDEILSAAVPYAFHSKYGYVTCCPTNIGTGLRISVMMHLPAIVYTKQIEKVIQSLTRVSYTIRGFYGEGTSPTGNFFQVSNQATLGRSEEDILSELKKVIPEIVRFELTLRERLRKDDRIGISNTIGRAYGVLKYASTITSGEALELLSAMRLGINMKIVDKIPVEIVNELMILTQPGHLQKIHGKVLAEAERDAVRASFIREKLKHY